MLIEIQVSDQSVTIALITGGTTVAVACLKATAEVAIAWIQTLRPRPPPPREIEPLPEPYRAVRARTRGRAHGPPSCASPWSLPALRTSGTLASGGKFSTASCGEGVWPRPRIGA